jgi:hypothetical protein
MIYFETILPLIEAEGLGPTCRPLTYFCQMAFTRVVPGGGSPTQVVEPIAPGRHVPLLKQAMELLHHHLPALSLREGRNWIQEPSETPSYSPTQTSNRSRVSADKLELFKVEEPCPPWQMHNSC